MKFALERDDFAHVSKTCSVKMDLLGQKRRWVAVVKFSLMLRQ